MNIYFAPCKFFPRKMRQHAVSLPVKCPHQAVVSEQGNMNRPPINISFGASGCSSPSIYFNRDELNLILGIYGRMVAAGLWKDYAVDTGTDCAVFSVFRRASENPEYKIIKDPSLANKQGAYAIIAAQGQILKRGQSLKNTLKIFERKLLKLVDQD